MGEGTDLVRQLAQWALQQLIEAEATEAIGADLWERGPGRVKGSFFPEILEPRRRIDQALYAVVMEAYVNGVSTRAVDDLVAAMGSGAPGTRVCGRIWSR